MDEERKKFTFQVFSRQLKGVGGINVRNKNSRGSQSFGTFLVDSRVKKS